MRLLRPSLMVAASLAALSCDQGPAHPAAEQELRDRRPANVVGRVDGRAIGADEARIVGARTGAGADEVADYLADRELLVSAALREGGDASFARKRAMVRALLEDEVEGQVGPEDVDKEEAKKQFPSVRRALLGACGFRAVLVTVTPEPIAERPARDKVFEAIAAGYAESLGTFVSAEEQPDEALATVNAEVSWPLRLERDAEASVSDARCPLDKSKAGWIHEPPVIRAMMRVPEDQVVHIPAGDVQYVAVKTGVIEPEAPTPEEVRAEVTRRQVAQMRSDKLDVLLERLREEGKFEIFPAAIDEQQATE